MTLLIKLTCFQFSGIMTYSIGDVVIYQWRDGKKYSDGYFLTIAVCYENAKSTPGLSNFEIIEEILNKPSPELLIFYLFSWKYHGKYDNDININYIFELYLFICSILSIDCYNVFFDSNYKLFCIQLSNKEMGKWRFHMEENNFMFLYDIFETCEKIIHSKIIKYHKLQ